MTGQQEKQHTVFERMFILTLIDGTDHYYIDSRNFTMCHPDEIEERRVDYEIQGHDDVEDFLKNALDSRVFLTDNGCVVTAHITSARCEVRATKAECHHERAACEHNAELEELAEIGDKVLNEAQEEEA